MFYLKIIGYLCFFICLIPVFLFYNLLNWKKKVRENFGSDILIKSLTNSFSETSFFIKFLFSLSALFILIFISTYLIKYQNEKVNAIGADVMICLDVSNSMLSKDINPSRIDKSISLLNFIIKKSSNIRFGIIGFSKNAFLQMPISADTSEARNIIKNISPQDFKKSGTDIGGALLLSLSNLNSKERRVKKIILITDGEDFSNTTMLISKNLKLNKIPVFAVGVGTDFGGEINIDSTSIFLRDENGNKVITKLNEYLLKEIAKTTDGEYYKLKNEKDISEKIISKINESYSLDKNNTPTHTKDIEIIFFVIAFSIFILIFEVLIPECKLKI